MKALPQDLVDQIHAARESLDDAVALLSLVEIGVFEALVSGPQSVQQLAEATGCVESRLQAYLDLGTLLGALVRTEERYALPGGPRRSLRLPRTPLRELLAAKGKTPDVLRGAPALRPPGSGGEGDAAARERFMRYLDGVSRDAADAVAEAVPGPVGHVVDLGSGAGTYTHALLVRDAAATATLVDRDETAGIAMALADQRGLGARVSFRAVALDSDPLPQGDTLLLSNVLHCFDAQTNRDLLARAVEALRPGGRLVIKDYAIASDRSGPVTAVRFAVNMAMSTDGGGVYSADQVADWCSEVGLSPVILPALPGLHGSYLILATR